MVPRLKTRHLSHSQHGATLIHHIDMNHDKDWEDQQCQLANFRFEEEKHNFGVITMSQFATGRQVYSDKGQNLLWAIKCKQTSRGCEFTTGNDHYLKGDQTQTELERKRNPGVKHQSVSSSIKHCTRQIDGSVVAANQNLLMNFCSSSVDQYCTDR